MNTRGLTGIVILSVGLQLHILDQSLYSLMIVMAIVPTAMAGPLLHLIYPDRFLMRDMAEADQAALETAAGHRILVLIEAQEAAAPRLRSGQRWRPAGSTARRSSPSRGAPAGHRLEVGTGLGGELMGMTRSTGKLQALADRASARGMPAVVQSRFSQDIAAELSGYVTAAEPDTIMLGPGGTSRETLAADGAVQLVTVLRSLPEAPSAVAALWTRGEGGAAAVLVAAQLAVADRLKLVISPAGGRRAGIADYRFIKVLSAISHGMSTCPCPNGRQTTMSSSR
jgi:hypothetical protein